MNQLALVCFLCVTISPLVNAETHFETVSAMIESFGDYSAEGRTFEVVSKNPLHIRLSPRIPVSTPPEAMRNWSKMAVLYGVFRAFIHTPCEQITVTAFPRTVFLKDGTEDFAKQYSVTVSTTRKKALQILQVYFPGKTFSDLVDKEDQRTKMFDALSYPDQGSPGMDVVLEQLLK